MKKLISLLSVLLFSLNIFSQRALVELHVPNSATAFGKTITVGELIFDESTNTTWQILTFQPSTATLTTAVTGVDKELSSSPVSVSDSLKAGVSDSLLIGTNSLVVTTSGTVGIGIQTPDASAILELQSASKGLLITRMTEAERDNIPNPRTGLMIYNLDDTQLELFDGVSWKKPQPAETLAAILASGKESGGNDIVLSNGDNIISADGVALNLRGAQGGNIGGNVNILGGFGLVTPGRVNITAGSTNSIGESVLINGGDGPTGKSGGVFLEGGTSGDDDGEGGDIAIKGGQGGVITGKGGDVTISSGDSEGALPGTLKLKGGEQFGFSVFGDIIMQENGGIVGIGTSNPATILDIQTSGPTVTIRNTADFGRSDIDLYGSRNAGAGNAELGTLSMFNTRSGSDEMVARIGFVNGASGTSAGGINFLTKENADVGLSIRLSIDDAGRVLINGEDASRVAPATEEIFNTTDLDALATGGVITVDGVSLSIILKDAITSTNRFNVINGGRLTLRFNAAWTYSGTANFLTVNTGGTINIKDGAIFGNSSATLFDITSASTVSFSNMTVLFFGEYGTIQGTNDVLMSTNGFFLGNGSLSLIDNNSTAISSLGMESDTPVSGALVRVSGEKTGFFDFSASNITLQSGESFIRFDPFAPILQATIDKVRVTGGELFDVIGGATGTFTAVADAAVSVEAINSVTDNSGIARFNFTAPPTLFVNQEVVISGFTTNTTYNGTFLATATGANFFEVSSIAFGTDETGSFTSASVTITDAAHGLSEGATLVIDVDGSTDYDGGAKIYNVLTNTFQINRTFTSIETGTWNTAGVDQTDTRILAFNNSGFIDSKYIATSFVNDNSEANGAIVNNTFTDMVFGGAGLVAGSTMERWKLIDELNGTFEYTGNEPFDGFITFDFTVVSSGGVVDFRFKWVSDSGGGFGDLTDPVEALAAVTSDAVSVTKTFPLLCNKGCRLKPQITRNSGSSGITTSYATIYATQ